MKNFVKLLVIAVLAATQIVAPVEGVSSSFARASVRSPCRKAALAKKLKQKAACMTLTKKRAACVTKADKAYALAVRKCR